ncbi:MAG: hypothetical protein CAF43_006470 [Nitrospira sp. CG24C]|jgi:deoxycytidylate deaminase|nr:MAG: hypothetical protein CAF43_006470 [Nitrospira sp. CG24C]
MATPKLIPISQIITKQAREILAEHSANELIFAVVGHVGSGTSEIARSLKSILESKALPGGPYETEVIKASDRIREWAKREGEAVPALTKTLTSVSRLQDLGDKMRQADQSAIARALVKTIRLTRAKKQGIKVADDGPIKPDGKRRAYILESIRHPAEVHLLRSVYGSSFTLIGIVCEQSTRLNRLHEKYSDAGNRNAQEFMERDAKAPQDYGQKVLDAFHLSDYFVDNSVDRIEEDTSSNELWTINEDLGRLVKVITHSDIVRPTIGETAMFEAQGAALRSACLSRQVGACVIDVNGNVVATGTNEVPVAGGGLYGESFEPVQVDGRCAYYGDRIYCRNTEEQNEIVKEIVDEVFKQFPPLRKQSKEALQSLLRRSRIGGLLEFSRAVHAEMDALLTAARKGVSSVGTRMWVTTFPCHYCARHIVGAGVDEVQFIEPYPKSKALDLHPDSITLNHQGWIPPSKGGSKVLFHPFTGVAPNLYKRAFMKDRELKNNETGLARIGAPEWGSPWDLRRISYVEIEAELVKGCN